MRLLLCITFVLAAAAVSRLEAEDGQYNGVALGKDTSDFTSRGYVTNFQGSNSLNILLSNNPGVYTILMRYRSPWGNKTTSIKINGASSGDVVLTQTSGWQQISLGRVSLGGSDTLTIVSNWGYYDVDNVQLMPFAPTRFEAEDGNYFGVAFGKDNTDFSGRGYATNFQGSNSLAVSMPAAPGVHNINIRFRCPYSSKVTTIQINGKSIGDVTLPQATAWQLINVGRATLGVNDTLTVVSNWGYYDVDYVEIVPLGAPVPNTRGEAEDGTYNGVTLGTDSSNFTGRGYVTNFQGSNSLNITVRALPGVYTILLRYRSPWSSKVTTLQFNGQPVGDVQLPQVSAWQQISGGRVTLTGYDTLTVLSNWGYYDIDNIEMQPFASNSANLNRNPVDPQITAEARGLFNFLQNNYGKKVLSGQEDTDGEKWLETNVGKAPAVLGLDFMDYSPSRVANGASSHATDDAINWNSRNGIVTFVWHWNAPTCVYNDSTHPWWRGFYSDNTCFDLQAALNEGVNGPNYQLLLRDIDAIAVQLKRLSDAKIPVLFRPLHEAEGGWFWWGAKGAAPAVQLYKLLFNRITQVQNLHNIVWEWNSISPDWYVGNNFCDMVSFDSYPQGADHSPQTSSFDKLTTLTGGTKMIAMAENGPIPDPTQGLNLGALYSYFLTWAGNYLTDGNSNSLDYLRQVYNSDLVLTLDKLGAWKSS